jgi:hypothetical protein
MSDSTTKHAGWMPSNPSMDGSGALAPDCDSLYGGADSSDVKSAGQTMGSTPMSNSGDSVGGRIMEDDIEYTWPGSGQGNLEPTGPRVKGT